MSIKVSSKIYEDRLEEISLAMEEVNKRLFIKSLVVSTEKRNEAFICDICKEKFPRKVWPDHFTGYINGDFSQHIHVCKDCIKEYDIEYLDITTEGFFTDVYKNISQLAKDFLNRVDMDYKGYFVSNKIQDTFRKNSNKIKSKITNANFEVYANMLVRRPRAFKNNLLNFIEKIGVSSDTVLAYYEVVSSDLIKYLEITINDHGMRNSIDPTDALSPERTKVKKEHEIAEKEYLDNTSMEYNELIKLKDLLINPDVMNKVMKATLSLTISDINNITKLKEIRKKNNQVVKLLNIFTNSYKKNKDFSISREVFKRIEENTVLLDELSSCIGTKKYIFNDLILSLDSIIMKIDNKFK